MEDTRQEQQVAVDQNIEMRISGVSDEQCHYCLSHQAENHVNHCSEECDIQNVVTAGEGSVLMAR